MTRRSFPLTLRRAVVLAAALALTAAGCRRDAAQEPVSGGDEEAVAAAPVPVRAATARTTTLRPSIELMGTIVTIPERTAVISPQIGRWVEKLVVVEGDTVQAGDELVLLDSRLAEVDLARARAAVDEKRAALERLKHGYLPQELEMASADQARAEAVVESLRVQVAAIEDLRRKHEISPVQYQKLDSDLQAARASLASARAKLKLLEAGARPEDIAQGEAQLASAQADLVGAQLTVQLCKITSPMDGTVTTLSARQGMFIDPAVTLAVVTDLSKVFAKARIPSAFQAEVRRGAPATVRVPSLPGKEFHGEIARISGQANTATGDVDAFASIANKDDWLRPGFACTVRIELPEVPDAVAIPVAAVADRDGTPVVTVVRDGRAYETTVALGVRTDRLVQVTRGLSPGDVVATEGGYGLPEGCPVTIRPDQKEASETGEPPQSR